MRSWNLNSFSLDLKPTFFKKVVISMNWLHSLASWGLPVNNSMSYLGSLQKAHLEAPLKSVHEKTTLVNYFSRIVNYKFLCLLKNANRTFSNRYITTNKRFYRIVLNKFKFFWSNLSACLRTVATIFGQKAKCQSTQCSTRVVIFIGRPAFGCRM